MVPEKDGCYLVCSGYSLLLGWFADSPTDSYVAIDQLTRLTYKQLWQAKVSKKMKYTISKFIWDLVLTKSNLYNRRLLSDSVCQRCETGLKMVLHVERGLLSVLSL